MKKVLFVLIMVLSIAGVSHSETIRKDEIVLNVDRFQGSIFMGERPRVTNYSIICTKEFDENLNQIGDASFGLVAHDDNFNVSDETCVLYVGSAKNLNSLIDKMIDFLSKAENGMSIEYNSYSIYKINNKINLSYTGERAHHLFKESELKNIKKKLTDYCKKNKIGI